MELLILIGVGERELVLVPRIGSTSRPNKGSFEGSIADEEAVAVAVAVAVAEFDTGSREGDTGSSLDSTISLVGVGEFIGVFRVAKDMAADKSPTLKENHIEINKLKRGEQSSEKKFRKFSQIFQEKKKKM